MQANSSINGDFGIDYVQPCTTGISPIRFEGSFDTYRKPKLNFRFFGDNYPEIQGLNPPFEVSNKLLGY